LTPRHVCRRGVGRGRNQFRPGTGHSRGFATMGKLFKIVLPVAIIAGLATVLLKKRKQA
jgi:hypothetical protein